MLYFFWFNLCKWPEAKELRPCTYEKGPDNVGSEGMVILKSETTACIYFKQTA
jgi:hypothetical protein